jgi:transcriptional regulator with XRE-family HTH domain
MPATTLGPGAKLRAARIAAGLTQAELAERLGIKQPSVAQAEKDRTKITLDRLLKFSLAIGCDPHSIDARLPTSRRTKKASLANDQAER